MKTVIIIVSYNAMPYIQKCLDSCKGLQVVMVDNNSTDGTQAYIKEKHPKVHLLPQNKNLGFGQANNLGMRYALEKRFESVFLLNQDAYLRKDCIEKLISIQKRNPDYGILSPIHLNGKGDRLDKKFCDYVAYGNNPDFYSDFVLERTLNEVYEVPFVNAAGWLLSKKILNIVGGFDPIFFHYGEDDNYCQRAKYHGFKIGVVPTAFMLHDREDRVALNIEHGTTQYFDKLERSLKIKFGNINFENCAELDALIVKRTKNKNRAYIKLEFSRIAFLKREIAILKRLKNQIYSSTMQSKIPDRSYLSNF